MPRQPVNTPIQQATTATPAWPPAGALKLYPKSDGNFYKLDSAGVEAALGTGGGGGSGGVVHEEFLPAASATSVTLGYPAQVIIMVAREGVVQSATDGNYSLAGVTVTFTDAFDGTERVVIDYSASSFVPPVVPPVNGSDIVDGSVTSAKIQNGTIATIDLADQSVTNVKLAADTARLNQLTNGGFEIWQRGNGPFTATTAFTADRWQLWVVGTSTASVVYNASITMSTGAVAFGYTHAAGGYAFLEQMVEATQLKGRVISLGLYGFSGTAVGVQAQIYTNGATPVSAYTNASTQTAGFEFLKATATVPLDATKVFIRIFAPGATCTSYLDNAMLVVGSVAADYTPLHPVDELMRCQRYYELVGANGGGDIICRGPGLTGAIYDTVIRWRVPKGGVPTVTKVGTWAGGGMSQPGIQSATAEGFRLEAGVIAVQGDAYMYNGAPGQYITVEWNP